MPAPRPFLVPKAEHKPSPPHRRLAEGLLLQSFRRPFAVFPGTGETMRREGEDGEQVVPGWLVELRARPLVRVVLRETRRKPLGRWSTYREWHELLECGHVNVVPEYVWEKKPPLRRRCSQCGRERLAAA